ncbi:MAG TPA: hypothetical protein DD670_01060 [Planctomycetaceae bacterium]|nr:hypothetical protein [Planctomycetaceae bacterium]
MEADLFSLMADYAAQDDPEVSQGFRRMADKASRNSHLRAAMAWLIPIVLAVLVFVPLLRMFARRWRLACQQTKCVLTQSPTDPDVGQQERVE